MLSGRSGQARLGLVRQLRQMTAHLRYAAILAGRADRAVNPDLASMLHALADRRRQAADRSRESLIDLGLTVIHLPGNPTADARPGLNDTHPTHPGHGTPPWRPPPEWRGRF